MIEPPHRSRYVVEASAGCPPEIGRWLWALEDTRRRTQRSLDGLSPAAIDWTDPHGDNSIGTLLYHLAAIEIDWLHTDVLQKPWPPKFEALFPFDVRDGEGRLIAVRGLSLEQHLRRLAAVRALFVDALRGMSLDEFRRVRRMDDYDVTPEWVIHHLIQHEAEHRGQIGELRVRAERALAGQEKPGGFAAGQARPGADT